MSAAEYKDLMRNAFDAWARGEGDFFRLLAEDVTWTVTGSSPVAGIYTSRRAFVEGATRPLGACLASAIVPTVHQIIADGDTVAVHWTGQATAFDGRPYNNTYCWIMRIAGGRVIEGTAFLHSELVTDLFARKAAADRCA